ncbi:MAG: hypothetical protein J6X89_03805 [Bacteroidales bacterium]|nr:hypothetical protein [Bacteroidales bacterium]
MMLKLEKPSQKVRDDYARKLLPALIKRIKNGVPYENPATQLSANAKAVLLPDWNLDKPKETDRLKNLLVSEPAELVRLEKEIKDEFDLLPEADRPNEGDLVTIMGYTSVFDSPSKSKAYWLAKAVGKNICVYCNRQYIFTVERGDGNVAEDRIVRPVFDHWFPKITHPLLSLSLFNLIPSCHICNSSVKGSDEYTLDTHIHPYVHEDGHPDFTFKVAAAAKKELLWEVILDAAPRSKEEKTIHDLCLNEIYSMHGTTEVNDLMEFKHKYPTGYLKQLMQDVLKKAVDNGQMLTLEEVYRMLFGVELKEEKFLNRPLSKMKHDILHEMGVI